MTTTPVSAARAVLPSQAGLASPYDGTTPAPGLGGYPLETGTGPGSLAGLDGGRAQVNATNQSALAPNGDINQTVTNENKYENKYYSIVTAPQYGYGVGGGVWNPAQAWPPTGGYGWGTQPTNGQQCYIDPYTGAMRCQDRGGILGWLQRLLRGY